VPDELEIRTEIREARDQNTRDDGSA